MQFSTLKFHYLIDPITMRNQEELKKQLVWLFENENIMKIVFAFGGDMAML